MIKNNSKGFVLAETLVVTVFLVIIFTMIYNNFYPLIGEYEKRESYDDVDGKYAVYWIKRMIEDQSYSISNTSPKRTNFNRYGYIRFECRDVSENDEKRDICIQLVKALQVEGCDKNGNNCNIFITKYQLGNTTPDFKTTVRTNLANYKENCSGSDNMCKLGYIAECKEDNTEDNIDEICNKKAQKNVFRTGIQDYIFTLPDYITPSKNYAKYRVIATFKHTKDNNNFYSYATIEVDK